MLLELCEVITCPRCGPPRVMVAVVHSSSAHRVETGFLACPGCDSRFAVEGGTLHIDSPGDPGSAPEPAGVEPANAVQAAALLAAVLALPGGAGLLLLGSGLASCAAPIAALVDRWEVVSVRTPATGAISGGEGGSLSRVVVSPREPLPFLAGRFRAVALSSGAPPARVREAATLVAPLGRLAVLSPLPEVEEALRGTDLEMLAADERVAVARRPS